MSYVCTAKGFSDPLTWRCRLAVFAPHRACSDPCRSTRPEIFASLVFMLFLLGIHHACAHLTHGGHVPAGPWKEPRSGCTGSLCPVLLRWRVAHPYVCCFSASQFVRWPFGVVSGSSVSLLCSLKWDQAKGWSLGSIILGITFSRCLGLDKQPRLRNSDCQFRPHYPGRSPL